MIYPEKEKEILLKMLKTLGGVLDDLNVTWSICAGTLLGAVRTGKFIPWDYDVDICVHSFDKIQEIYDEMYRRGNIGGSLEQMNTYGCGKFALCDLPQNPLCKIPTIDMYLIDYVKPLKLWRPMAPKTRRAWPLWNFPDPHYWPLKKIEFEGMLLPCPANPEALLKRFYGEDWETPNPNYEYHM